MAELLLHLEDPEVIPVWVSRDVETGAGVIVELTPGGGEVVHYSRRVVGLTLGALVARVEEVEAERDRLRQALREGLPVLLGNDESNDDWAGTMAGLCRLVGLRYPAGEAEVKPISIEEAP